MKVHKLLVAMVVVPRPFPSSVLAAGQIEGVGRRSSGLGSVWIRVCTVHGRTLILGVLRLRAVRELVVAMFMIIFLFGVYYSPTYFPLVVDKNFHSLENILNLMWL